MTRTIATGHYEWEQQLTDGYWSYDLDEVWQGIRESFRLMNREIKVTYGVEFTHIASLGISGMMHGYLAFDAQERLLVPFRTWRNNTAREAGEQLREAFQLNIPERWSIVHYYESVSRQEETRFKNPLKKDALFSFQYIYYYGWTAPCLINTFSVSNRQSKYYQFTILYITDNSIITHSIPPFSASVCRKSFALYSWVFTVFQIVRYPSQNQLLSAFVKLA